MGFKWLNLCIAALFLCPLKAGSIRAQCTQPSFASRNVILTEEHLSTQSFPDGSTVAFECVIGHKPADSKASKLVTCQGNQWTSLELRCTRKSCGALAHFLHGRYEMTGNLFGDTAKPVCDKGYMLAGQETTRTCRDQGWDGRDPLCEPVKCSAPPAIENGQLEDEPLGSYEYSQAVSYRCNGGLNLIGQSTLHCSEDGTFKPDPPKCFDGCPTPRIPNAKRIGGKSPPYKLGNFVEYKCEDGYTMKGRGYIMCRANGWDPEPPRCIAPCRLPELSEHVTLKEKFHTHKTFPHGSKVTVECVQGNEPVDATVSKTITCEETKWTQPLLTCKKMYSAKCQAPPIIENGQIEAVFYKCNSGFFLNGRSSLYCSEDGTFKQDLPKCLEGSVCDGTCLGKQSVTDLHTAPNLNRMKARFSMSDLYLTMLWF